MNWELLVDGLFRVKWIVCGAKQEIASSQAVRQG